MSFKTKSTLLFLAAIGCAAAADLLCPPLNDIGHATPQEWVFNNLNWTLTQISSGKTWPPPADDFDESRVAFAIESDFNDAPVQCSAEGKEFSEEYDRQLAGKTPTYNWYTCEGPSQDVKTEFKMVWWNSHVVDIRQTWTCPATGRPMRATGRLAMRDFDCVFDDESRRTSCVSNAGSQLPFEATIVEVLPPPTQNCAAASQATPDWTVRDLVWVRRTTTFGLDPGSANMTFRLLSKALDDYSPRMVCAEPALHGPQGGVYITPYTCGVFEANENDVPVTKFDWVVDDKNLLRINQTWFCDDATAGGTRFQSIGELDVKPLLSCSTKSNDYQVGGGTFVESFETCITKADFEIKGQLQ
ncbi:hypothetical protein FHL15_008106 [Xylaria flabelliformis]|uniref:Ig-like domain-containing protein n=1 Tax=Xylaria flabelliformis TaxID=2512241 RepID=A0A553HSH9_9PEZI|nr:hypothetical protein FHL15_008106 [Xylaria flabelliformis]